MKNKKRVILILAFFFCVVIIVGIKLVQKPEVQSVTTNPDSEESAVQMNDISEKQISTKNANETDNLELKDVTVRYQEKISEAFHGELSGGCFYYIDETPVYEKPGEDQAFLSVIDGSEVKRYGKKADFRRIGMTVLAKTIDRQGQFCQLEQDTAGKIYLVEYGEGGEKETLLNTEERTLETDFSRCVLMTDSKAIYVRAYNPEWKKQEEEMSNTLLVFSRTGKLVYEDYVLDMESKSDGFMVVLRKMPVAGLYVDFLKVNGEEAVRKDRKPLVTKSVGRFLCGDRSAGQWYCIEGEGIETFNIEKVTPHDHKMILDFGTDTSFRFLNYTPISDVYDNDLELLDGQVCDNGLISLLMGKKNGNDFVYRLYQYRSYEDTRTEFTLTITLPYPMPLVKQAVALYERKYPESYVKIESAYDTHEDFSTYLSTYGEQMTARILAGDFGDIICSSHGLRGELLLRSDAYMDLGDWVKTTEPYEDLNKGALKGLTVNRALRALPVGVDLYYYGINKKLAEEEEITDPEHLTWGQLLDIALRWKADGKKGRTLFGSGFTGEDLMSMMILNNLKDLVNVEEKSCDLKQEWFLELMRKWKEAYEAGYIYSYGQKELYRERNWEDTIFMNGFEKGSLLQAYCRRGLQFDWMDTDLAAEAENFNRYNAKYDCPQVLTGGIYGERSRNFSGNSSIMFSVNAKTEHREEALRFMEFLVSEQVQELADNPGIAMNLAVDRKKWEAAAERVTKEMESEYVTPAMVMEYYEQFSKVYEEIDQLYPSYYSLYIERPVNSYIFGTMTLEEAIDKAEQDLWLHLNE